MLRLDIDIEMQANAMLNAVEDLMMTKRCQTFGIISSIAFLIRQSAERTLSSPENGRTGLADPFKRCLLSRCFLRPSPLRLTENQAADFWQKCSYLQSLNSFPPLKS